MTDLKEAHEKALREQQMRRAGGYAQIIRRYLASLEAQGWVLVPKEALEPFAQFARDNIDDEGWTSNIHRESISTWFGPSDFRAVLNVPTLEGEE